jgi:hypothetical protein
MDTNGEREALPPLWPFLTLCAALALWIDLGSFHRHHTADSIVPVLISLYKWTPYYWECNRIGMLLPLLAAPFHHPLHNLLVQSWLALFATFAALFLLARYVLRSPAWPLAGAAGAGLFLLLPEETQFVFSFGHPHYAVALALGLAALLLAEEGPSRGAARLAAAAALMLLAHWVNSAAGVFLGPLILLRGLLSRPRWVRESLWGLVLLAAGGGGVLLCRALFPCADDPVAGGLSAPSLWPAAWGRLACNTWTAVLDGTWVTHSDNIDFLKPLLSGWRGAALGVLAAGVAILFMRPWPRIQGARRAALALSGAALLYAVAIATVRWVAVYSFHCRYGIPAVFFLLSVPAVLAAAPAAVLRGRARQALFVMSAPALLLGATAGYGGPSRAGVRADLASLRGLASFPAGFVAARAADVLEGRCTHVAGGYAAVWPVVFLANLTLADRSSDRTVWGLSGRCLPTWDSWGRLPPEDMRPALLTDGSRPDPDGEFYLNGFFPPLTVVERRATLWVLRPTDEVAPAAGAVLASWHSGFYPPEGAPPNGTHCCQNSGKLTLTNTSDNPRTLTLSMQLLSPRGESTVVELESSLFSHRLAATVCQGAFQRTVTLPPGKHLIQFHCDARPLCAPRDWRHPAFRVVDFHMTAASPLSDSAGHAD